MALSAGDRLGPYEILAPIGKGGMGEVYKARDTRIDRIVALKVSAAQFSERFEREAKAIGALNHPNICTLYDVGPDYLVMEYVEGAPLRGPLSVDQALKYAAQICEALDAAHKKGVTHRDLKPANILTTKTGIKLLDFGLAKLATSGIGQAVKPPDDATVTMALTAVNEILGTPAYMAPEQLEGKECDARSDIYALGLVLYEMLAGKRLLRGQPPLTQGLAPQVAHVIERCLESEPDRRWQSASDVRWELEWAGKTQVMAQATETRKRLPGWIWGVAVGVLALGVGLGWTVAHLRQPVAGAGAGDRPLVRLEVDLGTGALRGGSSGLGGADAILSPDGTRLAYVSQNRLFTRRLDQPKATELAGTEGAFAPFFSPEGQWVAFFAEGKLKKVSVEGGAAIALCDAAQGRGGSWGEDGNIIAALSGVGVLSRIPSSGGTPTPVTERAQGEVTQVWPDILPGGKAVLFTANSVTTAFDGARLEVMSLADHRRRTVVRGGTFGRYLPSGHLIYVNQGVLFAVPFDLNSLAVRGAPAPVLPEATFDVRSGSAQFSFSRTGEVVYRSGGARRGTVTVQWLDAAGKAQPLVAKPGFYSRPRLSPDGQRLALAVSDGSNQDVWIYEWQHDTMNRLTFGAGSNLHPIWSSDGRYVALETAGGGMSWTRADGAGKPQPLTQSKNVQFPFSFTADGRRLAFMETTAGAFQLWTLPVEGGSSGLRAGKPEPFLRTSFDERWPSFSPDGRWLAYGSNESGIFQVYVRAFPDNGGKWQVSNAGGVQPVWSRNGRELFFRTEDQRVMVTDYTVKGDSFAAGNPRVWSGAQLANTGLNPNYDLAPDGKRIVAVMPAEGLEEPQTQSRGIFLQNFFDEVRRRAPVGK